MKERPFNGNQENIFKSFEDRAKILETKKQLSEEYKVRIEVKAESNVVEEQQPIIENVIDDDRQPSGMGEFFKKHPLVTKTVASVSAILTVGSVGVPAFGAENPGSVQTPPSIEYKQTEPIGQKSADALNKLLADASATTPDTTVAVDMMASKEKIQSPVVAKMLIQTDSPYVEVTNSITGDNGVLKKMDGSITNVGGSNMIPTQWAELLGYVSNYDQGSRTATISNETKKITMTVGSKLMTVEETGKAPKKVTMTVPMQLDKSGKPMTAVGNFSKDGLGVEYQYDSKTKTIGINYSATEFVKIAKTEKINNELKYQALKYVKGGEYLNAKDFNRPLEKLSMGATVVYSSEKNKATEKKTILKYQNDIQKDNVIYCMGDRILVVKTIDNYVSRQGIKKENVYDIKNLGSSIEFTKLWNYPAIRIDYKTNGLVATDLLRVTHDYNFATKQWVERDTAKYEMLGNANQRIRKNLNKFVNATIIEYDEKAGKDNVFNNPISLDAKEVKEYCRTGKDTNCKSFKIEYYSNGDPAFFVNTSEKNGVSPIVLDNINGAVKRFNQIDPNILHLICEVNGMNCVSCNIDGSPNHDFFKNRNIAFGSYNDYPFGEVVFMNNGYIGFTDSTYSSAEELKMGVEYVLFVESRATRFRMHRMIDTDQMVPMDYLSNKKGINNEEEDKYLFALKTLNESWLPKKTLTKSEYIFWKNNGEAMAQAYDPSFKKDPTQPDDSNFAPEK